VTWFIREANRDPNGKSDPPSEQEINNVTLPDHGDSDYRPPAPAEEEPRETRWSFGKVLRSGQSQGNIARGQKVTVPSFKNMRLISQDECAATFRATWKGEDVVVKKCTVWKDHWKCQDAMEQLEHETKVYSFLHHLQGRYIPRMKIAGIADGIDLILVTEYAGTNIRNKDLTEADRMKIRTALSAIHKAQVLHGDLHRGNILIQEDGQDRHFKIIDFGLSKFMDDRKRLNDEMDELEKILA
ncbi:hypothetical protein BX616_006862, partial [Lobosporangium transversale]